jgi:putative zinc finger/helix-turn-helix YgiT family protein
MKSPITGKEMVLKNEPRKLSFRKEEFIIRYHYYLCKDTREQFTTTEIDELNMTQLYNQYREKYNLPFPEEIVSIREKYNLPVTKMSEILGFGVNSYRNYENGEVPSQANARLIQLADDPKKFKDLVKLSGSLDTKTMQKLLDKIDRMIEEEDRLLISFDVNDYLLDGKRSDEYTGYRRSDLSKLTEMVVYFTERLEPRKVMLNKLLFYADFLCFKRTGYSMSGARYRAINMGPVLNKYDSIFEYMEDQKDVDVVRTQYQDNIGEQFKQHKGRRFDEEKFDEIELAILKEVSNQFLNTSTNSIKELSHRERAWKENEKERKIISYKDYAFDIVGI